MNKIFAIIKREFLTRVMTKGFLIGTILGPVFIIGIMFLPSYFLLKDSPKSNMIGTVNLSEEMYNSMQNSMVDTLSDGKRQFKLIPMPEEQVAGNMDENFSRLINENVFDVILVFHENVIDSPQVTYYAKNINNFILIERIENSVEKIVNNIRFINAGYNLEEINQLKAHVDLKTIKVTKEGTEEKSAGVEYASTLVMVMMIYFGLIFYGQYIWKGIVEDKVSRIVEVLLSSVNSFQFMMGKLFGNGLIGLFQFGIWAAVGSVSSFYFVTAFPEMAKGLSLTPGIFGYFIVFFVLGYFFYSTFYAIVGAVSATSDDAQQLQMPFTMAIVGAFMLAFMAINSPDSQMTIVLSHIPFFTPIVMFTRILTSQPPLWEIGLAIIINIFSIILMIAVSAKIFRIGILMYGKRPNIPEIFKWLRR